MIRRVRIARLLSLACAFASALLLGFQMPAKPRPQVTFLHTTFGQHCEPSKKCKELHRVITATVTNTIKDRDNDTAIQILKAQLIDALTSYDNKIPGAPPWRPANHYDYGSVRFGNAAEKYVHCRQSA